MKFTSKFPRKSEKGQVLVIVALTLIALIAIMGLAIDTGYLYVSYSRLQRAVDAAALAGTGEFKPPTGTRDARIKATMQQMLDLNGVIPDPTASFTGPMSTVPGISIQTCDNTPGDRDLCKTPVQKMIRITVQTRVQLFFLAVIGIYNVPISIASTATAASLDVMLALDTSDSMTYDVSDDSPMFDPNQCNPHSCEPMEHVKTAAKLFSDKLYYPYDRLGIVYFDQHGYIKLPLSTDSTTIQNAIDNLTVYEGQVGNLLNNGSTQGTRCIYDRAHVNLDNRSAQSAPPVRWPIDPTGDTNYKPNPYGTCRLFTDDFAGFFQFDCMMDYGVNRDPSYCGRTNISEGISLATSALLGTYTGYPTPWPAYRDDSILTIVLLTDGVANAAFAANGAPVCPHSTWLNGDGSQACRDHDASVRHGSGSADYDADDMARDMFDIANGNNILIYTIGLGSNVTKLFEGDTGSPPGETLMKYPSTLSADDKYFYAPDSNALIPVFLAIADLITSRIKQ